MDASPPRKEKKEGEMAEEWYVCGAEEGR